MKALTLKDYSETPYATWVEQGLKTLETRTYPTKHRGDLLITCSASSKTLNAGRAVCVVEVVDCYPMTKEHEQAACCELYPRAWCWELKNLRQLSRKFRVKGQLQIFEVELPSDVQILQP
jgi:hypothetical protein